MEIKITNAVNTVVEEYKGVKLQIARSNSNEYLKKLRLLMKPFQRQIDSNELDPIKDIQITCDAMAGTVLVGWEPFKIGDTLIEYSVANAKNLLFNDPDCRKFVSDIAKSSELFERDQEEQVKGKSET